MGDKPNVVIPHVLEDVDKDQDSREQESEKDVRPIRDSVRGIQVRIQKYEDDQHQSREEE